MHRIGATLVSLLLICVGFLLPAVSDAADAAPAGIVLGEAEVIPLSTRAGSPVAQPTVRVIESDEQGLLLEFELPAIEAQAIEIDGEAYHTLDFEGSGIEGEEGEPMLPTFSRLIMIPDRAGVTYTVTGMETTELSGFRPFPVQADESGEFVLKAEAYSRVGYGDSEPTWVGEPALARALRVVPVTFRPLRYDPSRDLVEAASRIEVRVDFAGEDLRNVKTREHQQIPASFDQLYRNVVMNYEGPRSGQEVSLGSYVIIYPNNSTVLAKLQPLVEWRTRKGYEVYVASTSETGSSKESIKDWLEEAYSTWPNPPEYVTLIGDAGGSISIPTWYENYSDYYGEGDHPYTQLDGSDVLSDVHIGRISVSSTSSLEMYVQKIVGYESTPYMSDTSWYGRACVVGDPYYSKITCIQIMQWLKRRMLEVGYTDVDTVFSGNYVSQMRTSLNQGGTVFCYRGYLGMSGWENGDVYNLTNGWKMPYAVNLTCGSGSFAGETSMSEAWIRAGSVDNPRGGIASVATATWGTHTRFNNSLTQGIWRGIFWEDMHEFGASLTRGKYEFYLSYWGFQSTWVRIYMYWNNLMGDSAGEMWTGVPQAIAVDHPSQLALGANSVPVSVTAGGQPCSGAYVCLWKDDDDLHLGGYTDANGEVDLPVGGLTSGEMKITVTKHDHHPLLDSIDVDPASKFVGYIAHSLDDDGSDTSTGNGDLAANPLERIEIPVQVENFGTQTATSVTGTLTSSDPYVSIPDATEDFGSIAGGATAWSADDFDIELTGDAPHDHVIRLGLDMESGSDIWHSIFEVTVVAPELALDAVTDYDFGARIDPGESGGLSVRIRNNGGVTSAALTGTLFSQSSWINVTDNSAPFPAVAIGGTSENTGDHFGITISEGAIPGHAAPMILRLESAAGVIDTVLFSVNLAQGETDDPGGPDGYGYYAFDNTDVGYPDAPVYEWVEIADNYGGPGTSCGLSDFGNWDDDSKVFDLPFDFQFYGETFTKVTICSNGWIAMGSTHLHTGQNWPIPDAAGPDYMIAAMWDDLIQNGSNVVYHWVDTANHRYIIQWSRLRNHVGGSTENFEIILYDPDHYPTPTGDGQIVFQYDIFNNVDATNQYSTVGIQNGDQSDGIEYSYYNTYPIHAAPIGSGRAIKFTVPTSLPTGTLNGTVYNKTNGYTGLEGAEVTLLESGETLVTGPNGSYSGEVSTGTFTVVAAHESFAPDTAFNVVILRDGLFFKHFYLYDVVGPIFANTTDYGNTPDTDGPYEIYSTVTDYSNLQEVSLVYDVPGADWTSVPMEPQGGDVYKAEIPGQPLGAPILYYLYGSDVGDNPGMDPPGAPGEYYSFRILVPALEDDIEAGAGAWTHNVVSGGYIDEWHRSSLRNHTAAGSWSWKFGDTGAGVYADMSDGALVSDAFNVNDSATLTFWHWIDAETSGSYPGYAFDGGLLEMSVDGGAWAQITPEGDYPYLVREGSGPGPFPAETPIYSGTTDWSRARFELAGITGPHEIRFRFGSDGSVGQEGWYIDDVQVMGGGLGPSDAQELVLHPKRVALYQNTPNPVGAHMPGTLIRFDLLASGPVRLGVFDIGGRLVRTLVDGSLEPGQHTVSCNRLDAHGRRADSGVYFYTLETDNHQLARRMLLVR